MESKDINVRNSSLRKRIGQQIFPSTSDSVGKRPKPRKRTDQQTLDALKSKEKTEESLTLPISELNINYPGPQTQRKCQEVSASSISNPLHSSSSAVTSIPDDPALRSDVSGTSRDIYVGCFMCTLCHLTFPTKDLAETHNLNVHNNRVSVDNSKRELPKTNYKIDLTSSIDNSLLPQIKLPDFSKFETTSSTDLPPLSPLYILKPPHSQSKPLTSTSVKSLSGSHSPSRSPSPSLRNNSPMSDINLLSPPRQMFTLSPPPRSNSPSISHIYSLSPPQICSLSPPPPPNSPSPPPCKNLTYPTSPIDSISSFQIYSPSPPPTIASPSPSLRSYSPCPFNSPAYSLEIYSPSPPPKRRQVKSPSIFRKIAPKGVTIPESSCTDKQNPKIDTIESQINQSLTTEALEINHESSSEYCEISRSSPIITTQPVLNSTQIPMFDIQPSFSQPSIPVQGSVLVFPSCQTNTHLNTGAPQINQSIPIITTQAPLITTQSPAIEPSIPINTAHDGGLLVFPSQQTNIQNTTSLITPQSTFINEEAGLPRSLQILQMNENNPTLQTINNISYQCYYCKTIFKDNNICEDHVKYCIQNQNIDINCENSTQHCIYCLKTFNLSVNLFGMHLKKCREKLTCKCCSNVFFSRKELKNHEKQIKDKIISNNDNDTNIPEIIENDVNILNESLVCPNSPDKIEGDANTVNESSVSPEIIEDDVNTLNESLSCPNSPDIMEGDANTVNEASTSNYIIVTIPNCKSGGLIYRCSICRYCFESKSALSKHSEISHSLKLKFIKESSLNKNKTTNNDNIIKVVSTGLQSEIIDTIALDDSFKCISCKFCCYSFSSNLELKSHMTFYHQLSDETTLTENELLMLNQLDAVFQNNNDDNADDSSNDDNDRLEIITNASDNSNDYEHVNDTVKVNTNKTNVVDSIYIESKLKSIKNNDIALVDATREIKYSVLIANIIKICFKLKLRNTTTKLKDKNNVKIFYFCRYCLQIFQYQFELAIHLGLDKLSNDSNIFIIYRIKLDTEATIKCALCPNEYNDIKSYSEHIKICIKSEKISPSKLVCITCCNSFEYGCDLNKHQIIMSHGSTGLACQFCKIGFPNIFNYLEHRAFCTKLLNHYDKPITDDNDTSVEKNTYYCQYCTEYFYYISELMTHLLKDHEKIVNHYVYNTEERKIINAIKSKKSSNVDTFENVQFYDLPSTPPIIIISSETTSIDLSFDPTINVTPSVTPSLSPSSSLVIINNNEEEPNITPSSSLVALNDNTTPNVTDNTFTYHGLPLSSQMIFSQNSSISLKYDHITNKYVNSEPIVIIKNNEDSSSSVVNSQSEPALYVNSQSEPALYVNNDTYRPIIYSSNTNEVDTNTDKNNSNTTTFYTCKICCVQFTAIHKLTNHFKYVHTAQILSKFKCKFCYLNFESQQLLLTHVHKTHNVVENMLEKARKSLFESNTLKCFICHEIHSKQIDLRNHYLTCHKILIYIFTSESKYDTCNICLINCSDTKEWELHKVLHHSKLCKNLTTNYHENNEVEELNLCYKMQCIMCLKVCPDKRDLQYHLLYYHSMIKPISTTIPCLYCNLQFYSKYELHFHIVSIHRACKICNIFFDSIDAYLSHKRDHDNNKISYFSCPYCTLMFSSKEKVDDHILKPKPYYIEPTLEQCDINIESSQSNMESSQLLCSHCSLSFNSKENFDKHLKSNFPYHGPVKKYVKVVKKFVGNYTEATPNSCVYCDGIYTKPNALYNHIRQFHNVMTCVHCNEDFTPINVFSKQFSNKYAIPYCQACIHLLQMELKKKEIKP